MEVAALTTRIEVDVSKLQPSLDTLHKNVDTLAKQVTVLATNISSLRPAADQAGSGLTRFNQRQQDAVSGSANLGRYMRVLTTNILGVNPVAIALGTALGNLGTQVISRLVLGIIESVTQFTSLQNELAAVSTIGARTASSFAVITAAAEKSQKSLSTLTKSYIDLQQQAIGTRVSVEEVNKIFLDYETHLGKIQTPTIISSASQLLTGLGDLFSRIENALGAGSGIVWLLGKIRDAVVFLTSYLPKVETGVAGWNVQLAEAQARATNFAIMMNKLPAGGIQYNEIKRKLNEELRIQTDLEDKIAMAEGRKLTPERELQRLSMKKNINAELQQEIQLGAFLPQQQEELNKQLQIENQLRSTGRGMDEAEKKFYREKAMLAVASTKFGGIRTALEDSINLENESYKQRLVNLQNYYRATDEARMANNQYAERAEFAHRTELLRIQIQAQSHMINAEQNAGNAVVNVMQILGQKSKGWAVASLALSTALNAQRVIQSTATAVMNVMADPTIPFLAKPGVIAGVEALGAVQLGAVLAAGALQIGGAIKGTGGGGGGIAGGDTTASASTTPTMPNFGTTITIEGLDPAQTYSGSQLIELMDRMNDAVKNGATVIATKVRGG